MTTLTGKDMLWLAIMRLTPEQKDDLQQRWYDGAISPFYRTEFGQREVERVYALIDAVTGRAEARRIAGRHHVHEAKEELGRVVASGEHPREPDAGAGGQRPAPNSGPVR